MSSVSQKRLKKARHIRHVTASQLNALASQHVTLFEILETPTQTLMRVPIYDLLRRAPKLGRDGARKILTDLEIWPYDRLGSISLEKRRLIASRVPERVPRERIDAV